MTKSKKLISMLLAFVMLVTSCSLSFFAFADEAEDIAAANAAAETAINSMNLNTVSTDDEALLTAVNKLTDVTKMDPVYYSYALHVATNKIIRGENGNKNPTAATRAAKLKLLGEQDAGVIAQYAAVLKVPADYITVIKDFNDANNTQFADSVTNSKIRLITDNNTNNLNFATNPDATAALETFWNSYENYTYAQLLFSDFVPMIAANGVTNQSTAANLKKQITDPSPFNPEGGDLKYYFGERQAKRIGTIMFTYAAAPINANVVKAKYIKSSKWLDTENGPTDYYNELKSFYTNLNASSKDFYVQYTAGLENNNDTYEGLSEAVEAIITVGLALKNGDDVAFSDVKAAFKKYDALSYAAKGLIDMMSENIAGAVFNPILSNLQMRENINFEDDAASIEYLAGVPGAMSNASTYTGTKLAELVSAVADAYVAGKAIDEYEELVASKLAQATITADDAAEVWTKFNSLSAEDQNAVRETSQLWEDTTTVMVAPFVSYVDAVDLDAVTDANISESTALLEGTEEEFRTLLTSDDYKDIYAKYQQIQIAKFRYYVEGVDLNNITAENRTQAKALYDALTDELKAVAQADEDLYNTYLTILASEFKDYINAIDLASVDESVREEAAEKYRALSDDAKKLAYEDDALWAKYTQIQTPDVDTNKHEAEAAKKADKVTVPTTAQSEAVKDLGIAKSIDNVEDFVEDDLLPLLTDQIKITDKNDVVNSALEQHLTNATIGKLYGLYASLSHNQTDMGGVTAGTLVQTQLIPKESLVGRFYEEDFQKAQAKIYNVIATNAIPQDEEGNPLPIDCGEDADGNTIYEDANIYDGIAAIEFENGDFGFQDGDRDGFVKALLAVLRPITGICAPGSPLGIEFFNHVDKASGEYTFGIYECCLMLLEALGVTGMPTDEAYMMNYYTVLQTTYATAEGSDEAKQFKAASIAGDEYLKPIINGVFAFADSELKTLTDILALLPRLGDIIRSDMPSVCYKNLKADLGMLSGLLSTINYQGTDVPIEFIVNKNVLPIALFTLINEKLESLGVQLEVPNWDELNKYTTFKVNKSSQKDKDYVAVRYIDGDAMFTELIYYAYDNLFANEKNAAALSEKLGGLPLVGENLAALVPKAQAAGKVGTYAAILDYFYESEEERNYDATKDAGKSIGDALKGINDQLNLAPIDCSKAVVKLSKTKYAYNGKIQKPSVTVTLGGEKLTKGIAYKVKYSKSSSKKIGTYKVTVTFIGGYTGKAVTKKYTIGPKKPTKVKLTAKSKAIKVSWKKSATKSAKGYVIQYSTSKSFKNAKTVTVKGRSKTSKTIKGLKKGKKYYVRVRAYTVKSGKKIYSPYTGKKAVKTK